MSRWERTPLPASLDDEPDHGLEEIPTVLMSSSSGGSEVLFEDLRERYRRALDTPELTSPSVRAQDAIYDEDVEGFDMLDHPTGDIDPLSDYLEMHALRTGTHPRIDERSDPVAHGLPAWPQDPLPGLNRVDTPPPQEFARAPQLAPPSTPPPAPPAARHSMSPSLTPSAQGAQPHRTPSTQHRVEVPANQSIPIESAYRQVYGRTIRPNPTAEHGSHAGGYYAASQSGSVAAVTAYDASYEAELDLEPMGRAANPHRWDAWILAGFAISGIWALALVRILL